jgi:protein TonB
MTAAKKPTATRRWPGSLRWGACFALALGLHAAGAAALLAHWNDESDLVANAPVIMIDLAPAPVAPDITPTEVPPDQVLSKEAELQPEPEKPVEKTVELPPEPRPEKPLEKTVELPPEPQPEPVLTVTPPPKPIEKEVEKKPKQKHASLASAPSTAERKAARAAAPAAGASSQNPNAVPNWKSQLVAKLERSKRYPSEAQSRHEQGVVQLAFSIDRSGGIHNARIAHSSGSRLLDEATLALVEREAPLPPPPPEIARAEIPVVVPIRYNIR